MEIEFCPSFFPYLFLGGHGVFGDGNCGDEHYSLEKQIAWKWEIIFSFGVFKEFVSNESNDALSEIHYYIYN